jgi:hypothetical protein
MRQLKVFGLAFAVVLSSGLLTSGVADAEDTPDQIAFRNQYVAKTQRRTREILDTGHKARTAEENAIINKHWNTAFKAIRIRELAQDDNDQATVTRVDNFLSRLDNQYYDDLSAAVARAPDRPGAPKLLYPVNGSKLAMGRSHALCRFAPDQNAVSYSCILTQGSTHHSHNYFCSRSGDCFGDVNDGTFKPGPAQIVAAMYIQDQYWSEQTRVDVELVEASPPPRFEAPAANDKLPIDKVINVKFADYPSATKFHCGIRQGFRSAMREIAAPSHECPLHPSKDGMNPGTAELWGQAYVNDRWTDTVRIPIQLTGDKFPAPFVTFPRPGQTLVTNQPFTCKADEYPGAIGYKCTIKQGAHTTNNSAMGYAATAVNLTPENFVEGPATVLYSAMLEGGKSTEVAHVTVNIQKPGGPPNGIAPGPTPPTKPGPGGAIRGSK